MVGTTNTLLCTLAFARKAYLGCKCSDIVLIKAPHPASMMPRHNLATLSICQGVCINSRKSIKLHLTLGFQISGSFGSCGGHFSFKVVASRKM